ncbi:NosD domain-containing protein [Myxococcota bacterium]
MLVEPVYSNFVDWNKYLKRDQVTLPIYAQSGVPCNSSENGGYDACVHGAEMRMVVYDGTNSCGNLTIADELGIFEWVCEEGGTDVTFYSLGLLAERGLGHLLTNTGQFKQNRVSIWHQGQLVAQSAAAVWSWNNDIVVLADNGTSGSETLGTVGTIYLVNQTRDSQGYVINANEVAFVVLPGMVLKAAPTFPGNCSYLGEPGATYRRLICAGTQDFLWIEGSFDSPSGTPTASGFQLAALRCSRFNMITIRQPQNRGIHLQSNSTKNLFTYLNVDLAFEEGVIVSGGSNNNSFHHLRVSNSSQDEANTHDGIHVGDSTDNAFYDVLTQDNGGRGFYAVGAPHRTTLVRVTSVSNEGYGVALLGGNEHQLHEIAIIDNMQSGISIANSNGSSISQVRVKGTSDWLGINLSAFNSSHAEDVFVTGSKDGIWVINCEDSVFKGITVINGAGWGFRIFGTSYDNTVTNLLAANNGKHGVYLQETIVGNTLNHVTAANNLESGIVNVGVDTTLADVLMVNNAIGLNLTSLSGGSAIHTIVAANNVGSGIRIDWTDAVVMGDVLVGNNGVDCEIAGTGTNVMNGTCSPTDGGFALTSGVDATGTFWGKVSDGVNPSGSSGNASYADILDWLNFENVFRGWGMAGLDFPDVSNQGHCGTGTCQIWDWRLDPTDTVSRNHHGTFQEDLTCPAGIHGDVSLVDRQSNPNTFLVHAQEETGDGDGLCETRELCRFSPHVGAYQLLDQDLGRNCTFQDGLVTSAILLPPLVD